MTKSGEQYQSPRVDKSSPETRTCRMCVPGMFTTMIDDDVRSAKIPELMLELIAQHPECCLVKGDSGVLTNR